MRRVITAATGKGGASARCGALAAGALAALLILCSAGRIAVAPR